MNIKFTKQQVCTILEKFYKEERFIKGKVSIKHYTSQVGFEMYPTTDVIVEMKISGEINLDGMKATVEKRITMEDLKEATTYFLSDLDQEIEKVKFDKGITSKTTGYGMCESTKEQGYFNGIIVELKNKTKKRGGM